MVVCEGWCEWWCVWWCVNDGVRVVCSSGGVCELWCVSCGV